MTSDFVARADLAEIRYSQVWEDHRLVEEALQIQPDDDVLSIGSAGCNVLAALLKEPRSITALDASPAQCALIELKLAALQALEYEDFTALLGASDHYRRLDLYAKVRPQISPGAQRFWDAHSAEISSGIIACGRLERYFTAFQRQVTERLFSPQVIEELFTRPNLDEQRRFFQERLATAEYESAFRQFFGREMLSTGGRDPSQFVHIGEVDIGVHFWRRFCHALTATPAAENFYVQYLLTGRYRSLEKGPPYLRRSNFARLRQLASRVSIVQEEIGAHLAQRPAGAFSKANLSDLFEYMSASSSDQLFALLGERMRAAGRLCYWNLVVPRRSPDSQAHLWRRREELARDLWESDRACFYQAFHVEEVIGS